MDEYLFITLAKLKADRLRLEREQRAALPAGEPSAEPFRHSATRSAKQASKSGWFSRTPQWREQS